jgi:NAD(P)-dependent dehydrogenase (short-subunit alcohol dehydrogenase family)
MDERVAIITGGGSGIGAAAARVLAERGLAVALVGRRRDRLDTVVDEISAAGGRALAVPADLAEPNAPGQVVDAVKETFGRLDVLVNNAATYKLQRVDQFTPPEFDHHVAVNVRAPYFLVQAALPALRDSPAAVIVNVSSAAAVMYRPSQTVYALTKAALEHLTMNLAAELAPDGIRVVCVRPGPVRTDFHLANPDPAERLRLLESLVPLGRVGEPGEVARWIAHLVDLDAGWVTGSIVTIDGGRILGPPNT